MATKAGVGESIKINPFEAGAEAARLALEKAEIQKCDFVLLFSTAGYDQEEMLRGVRTITGDAPLSGCSGEGIITQNGPAGEGMFTSEGLQKGEDKVAVMVYSSDTVRFFNCCSEGVKTNSKSAGIEIGECINRENIENQLTLLLFPDGMTVNAKDLFEGLDSVLEKSVPYCGGTAGENLTFVRTYQYYNDKVLTDSVSCVLISGNVNYEIGVSHGCTPISRARPITKAVDNNIYEIDGKPAWDFFKEYLPDGVEDFGAELVSFFVLGEKVSKELAGDYGKYITRVPLNQNPDGSLYINTVIPTGANVYMMRRDEEKVSGGAANLAKKIKDKIGDRKPIAVIHIDCAGRGKRLFGDDTKRLGVDVIQDVLGKDVPWLGFYSYGEIAPVENQNLVHNVTVVLLVLY